MGAVGAVVLISRYMHHYEQSHWSCKNPQYPQLLTFDQTSSTPILSIWRQASQEARHACSPKAGGSQHMHNSALKCTVAGLRREKITDSATQATQVSQGPSLAGTPGLVSQCLQGWYQKCGLWFPAQCCSCSSGWEVMLDSDLVDHPWDP